MGKTRDGEQDSNPDTLRPIETVYMGYRFRSRLEARWAVFFKTLGVHFRYEMEGFDLGDVRYLPDFHLEGTWALYRITYGPLEFRNAWVEVKAPLKPNYSDIQSLNVALDKMTKLVEQSGVQVCGLVLFGEPWPRSFIPFLVSFCKTPNEEGRMVSKNVVPRICFEALLVNSFGANENELDAAYSAARGARFEHGETPR